MFLKEIGSLSKIMPISTLVIGSNIHKIEVVVGPIFLTPICIKLMPMTEVKILTINEYIHAVGVKYNVNLPLIIVTKNKTIDAKTQV